MQLCPEAKVGHVLVAELDSQSAGSTIGIGTTEKEAWADQRRNAGTIDGSIEHYHGEAYEIVQDRE